jgi:hypothetical protein
MATLFLCLTLASLLPFLLLMNKPYGLQEASMIIYTIFEMFFTFAATPGFRPLSVHMPRGRAPASCACFVATSVFPLVAACH